MASGRNKKRMNVNGDRLSSLPDDVIHEILSFVSMKDVVKTSSLSSRWRFLWTSMPNLYFSCHKFPSMQKFYQSVIDVLRNRNNEIQVSSVYLRIYGSPIDAIVNVVLRYAICHNVQELTIGCYKKFHLFNFSSESLKVLTLSSIEFDYSEICISNWELPALTTLHLIGVTLYDDEDFESDDEAYEDITEAWDEFFSKCPNLKYLTFDDCRIGWGGFRVCHPQVQNLTLANGDWGLTAFTVDTPQLRNLSIINCGFVGLLSAPLLTSLIYRHLNTFVFGAECLPSLEKVDLCICNPHRRDMNDIVDVLQKFQSVKFLTINSEIPELLSSELNFVSNKPSPFANLKSLKIYPAIIDEFEKYDYDNDEDDDDDVYEFKYGYEDAEFEDDDEEDEDYEEEEEEEEEDEDEGEGDDKAEEDGEDKEDEDEDEDDEVNIRAEVKNFFLNSSPSATITKVTCQEIRAVTNPELATNLMDELQVLLKEEKAKIIKLGKAPMKSHVTKLDQQGKTQVMEKMQFLTEERMLSNESRWEDPSVQYYLENGMIGHMVSKLQAIRDVLATLPTSNRAQMKAVFRRLFAEANLVMKKLDDASLHNIGEEHVEEQLPPKQKVFDTTQGRWGKWYKRRWGKRYERRSKQQEHTRVQE